MILATVIPKNKSFCFTAQFLWQNLLFTVLFGCHALHTAGAREILIDQLRFSGREKF